MTPTERDTALARLREAFPESAGWKHSIQTVGGTSTVVVFCGPIQAGSSQLAGDRSELDLAEYLITAWRAAQPAPGVGKLLERRQLLADRDALLALVPVLERVCSALDSLMGDSDIEGDESEEFLAMQSASMALAALPPHLKEVQP